MQLDFAPNEVVGYRIKPDAFNWTVVRVKKHGAASKYAGEEYESTGLAYCKNLTHAVDFILNKEAKLASEYMPLLAAFEKAKEEALKAVHDLEQRLTGAGVDLSRPGRLSLELPVQHEE
jgi:hypothetical protein